MRSMFRFLAVVFLLAQFAKATPRPNILFAIADDWGFGHAGAYGCKWVKTPAFDRVAREGILFTRAFTPNAKCAPSRAIILTGRYSWQLEEAANHQNIFPSKFGSYVEVLAANGYMTGYTGKGWGPGTANDAAGKRRDITGKVWSAKKQNHPHGPFPIMITQVISLIFLPTLQRESLGVFGLEPVNLIGDMKRV